MKDKIKPAFFTNDGPIAPNVPPISRTVVRKKKVFDPQEQDAWNMQMFQMQQMHMRIAADGGEQSGPPGIKSGGGSMGGGASTGPSSGKILSETGKVIEGEGGGTIARE
jgi:uncharacterized membrane protein YgcG